ncbi:CBS domain-containing protein [Halomicroarcula sp. S1AR25-4]|uniref:CBS domain-containing protein n=1 Tax=Haloarcula onubensis TaxID=2950539 RepID=A0ABU2FTC5_9EURY|nr:MULTISPECIES: CBS domain-containing protein [unclassified Halomicroarcula]MDS0276586.1 CBS domain-containing protein [Halomicroarcula sp. S1AR25-4]MDS0284018.1 CBS domain-containing protein [Halomicroarcula sp. S3CR25-11]
MPRELYHCTATELATSSVEHLSYDTTPADAAAWLTNNGYDTAPIYRDGTPVGFIHITDIDTDTDGDDLADHLTPLTIDHIISGDAAFPTVLSALIEKPVYFLGGHNHVNGVLTRADLNTGPARIYLFDRITHLEEHLRELILDKAPDWKNTPVTVDELDDINSRYEDAKAANIELDELHYAQFSTLETIVTSVEACWQTCGFTSKGGASTRLHEITELRNDVAHANLLIENTDSNDFLSSGRTTENLHDTLETINQVLTQLQDAGHDPDPEE